MSNDTATVIQTLTTTSTQLNRYLSIFIFLFGILGNILNCLVFSRRPLRSNPCALLFLLSAVASLVSIVSGLTTRILAGWAADLTTTIRSLCMLRTFVLFVARTIALWFLALVAIDRWLCSSIDQRRRRMSSTRNNYRNVVLTTFLSMVLYAQVFHCYAANTVNTPLKCYSKTGTCSYINDLSYALISVVIPIVVMVVFGSMTISNVRRSQRRVFMITSGMVKRNRANQSSKWRRADQNLLLMLLAQIILLTLFTLPQALQRIYSTFTEQQQKSSLQRAIESFIFNLLVLSIYFSDGIPFYLYILFGGKIFRKALVDMLRKWSRRAA